MQFQKAKGIMHVKVQTVPYHYSKCLIKDNTKHIELLDIKMAVSTTLYKHLG